MTYTVLSARYSDADNASIVANTVEVGDVVLSPDQTPEEWAAVLSSGIEIEAYSPPPPAAQTPYLWGVGQFGVTPGDITGIELSVGFSAALYLDTGLYYLFFNETLPDTTYLAKAYDASALVRVSEKGTDYIAITATDTDGVPVDPSEISVEIIRVS